MQVVVREIVYHIAQQASGRKAHCLGLVQKQPESIMDGDEEKDCQNWRKDQSHGVHGQQVMHAMQEEMKSDGPFAELNPLVEVEQVTMQRVLKNRPHNKPRQENSGNPGYTHSQLGGINDESNNHGKPNNRHNVPRSAREELQEIRREKPRWLIQDLGCVDVFGVLVAEAAHLGNDGLGIVDQALLCFARSYGCPCQKSNSVSIKHCVRCVAVHMHVLILKNLRDVSAQMRHYDCGSTRVLAQEPADIVHLAILDHPGIALLVVLLDFLPSVCWNLRCFILLLKGWHLCSPASSPASKVRFPTA
mmetsp:Transcript_22698/g.35520  ORF Transcript_22698/g.35520 Transcript_22698/m.35520 type:complete len:304 (-) Transcript_22698:59-970(-)